MFNYVVKGLLLLSLLPSSKTQIKKKACTCNGHINERGQGECRTAYKGSLFCFVDDNDCEDGIKCNFKYPGKPRLVYSYLACTNYRFKLCRTKSGRRCHFPFYYKGERYSECTTTIFDPDENKKEFKDLAKECNCKEEEEEEGEGGNQLTGLAGLGGKGKTGGNEDEEDPCICYCENRRTGGGLLGFQGSKRRGRPRTGLGAYGRAGTSGLGGLGGQTGLGGYGRGGTSGLGGLGNTGLGGYGNGGTSGLGGYGNGGTSGLGNTGLGGYGRGGTSGLGGLGGNTGLGGYGNNGGLGGGRTGLGGYGRGGTSGLGGLGGRTGLSGLAGNAGSNTALGGINKSGLGGLAGCAKSTIAKLPEFKEGGSRGEAWCATVRSSIGKVERWEECGFGCSGFDSTNSSGLYFDSPPCAGGPG